MLINPDVGNDTNISWICDGCGTMLNIQDGFNHDCGKWQCTECGYANKIDMSEVYISEDEYQTSKHNPYKGLSDAEVLELQMYEEVELIDGRSNTILVHNDEENKLYIKKYLKDYDLSIYKYLRENPVERMPRIIALYEGDNNLVVIEEYICGHTLAEIIESAPVEAAEAIRIAKEICRILEKLHNLEKAIIHRDIKPSNIMLDSEGIVYLLDMNVAKWYIPEETEDTKLFGTMYYAAPEQFGYGFSGSSAKSDIYAVGIMLNVMLTGKFPKEEKAPLEIWKVIEQCTCMEPDNRLSASELLDALDRI